MALVDTNVKVFKEVIDASHTLSTQRFTSFDSISDHRQVYYWKTETTDTYASAHLEPPPERTPTDPKESFDGTPVCTLHPQLQGCDRYLSKAAQIRFPPLWEMRAWPRGGPWEQQLLMQPPCKEIEIHVVDMKAIRRATLQHEQGVTFGHVLAKLREIVEIDAWEKDPVRPGGRPVAYGWVEGFIWEGSEWVSEAEQNQTRVEVDRWLAAMTDVLEEEDHDVKLN